MKSEAPLIDVENASLQETFVEHFSSMCPIQ